jgi:Flp pilus assembly protein CpaB
MKNRLVQIGLSAVFLSCLLVWYRKQSSTPHPESNVVIAARDLPIELRLVDEDTQVASRVGSIPSGCLLSKSQIIGQRVLLPLQKGDVVCLSNLAPADEEISAPAPGMRALWLPISKGADSIHKGDHVDVLISSAPRTTGQGKAETDKTATLLQNVVVLAVGQQKQTKNRSIIPLALLVSPDDAGEVSAAGQHGTIEVALTSTPAGK